MIETLRRELVEPRPTRVGHDVDSDYRDYRAAVTAVQARHVRIRAIVVVSFLCRCLYFRRAGLFWLAELQQEIPVNAE